MSFYPIIGIIAMFLIGGSVYSSMQGDMSLGILYAGLASTIMILGASFILCDIHEVITTKKKNIADEE